MSGQCHTEWMAFSPSREKCLCWTLPPPPLLVSFHWKLFSSTNRGQGVWSFKHLQILYGEFCSRKEIPSTAQAKLKDEYPNLSVDWKETYLLVFNVTLDTKVRVFQYKFWYKLNFSKARLLAKFYMYRCKLHNTKPSLEVLRLKWKPLLTYSFWLPKEMVYW